jgi:hypothetical protein
MSQTNENETTTVDEHSERSDEVAFDEAALEAKVGAGLEALEAGEDVTEAMSSVSKPDESDSDDDGDGADVDEVEEAEEDASEESDTEEAAAEDDAVEEDGSDADDSDAESDAPTLPANHRRSLKAYGWEDDEIDQNLRVMGDQFLRTAQRIHDNRSKEIQHYAEQGRKLREEQSDSDDSEEPKSESTPSGPNTLEPIDVDKLKDEFGDDALIDKLVGPVNSAINRINAIAPQLESGQSAVNEAQHQQLEQIVTGFFGGDDLRPYSDLYGGKNPQTPEQWEARDKVLDMADALMYGSQAAGRSMSVEDALMEAHNAVSAEHRAKTERKKLRDDVKKRNQGTTLKPGGRKKTKQSSSGKPKTEAELERRTGERMARVFGTEPS